MAEFRNVHVMLWQCISYRKYRKNLSVHVVVSADVVVSANVISVDIVSADVVSADVV